MAGLWAKPTVEFEVKVVRVSGLEAWLDGGSLFVRYYIPAGDGRRRLRVDTREVPCDGGAGAGDVFYGELARFERRGGGDRASVGGVVVFELRWRPRASAGMAFLGAAGRPSSRALARAEIAWEDVAGAFTSSSGTWLRLSPAGRELGGCKAPKLLVDVKMIDAGAAAPAVHEVLKARRMAGVGVNHCCRGGERCGQCGWVGSEEDMFLAATFT